jgi:hypothetical protein
MVQAGRWQVRKPMKLMVFPVYPILPALLGPGVNSASNRNEYRKLKKKVMGSKTRPVRGADNIAAICEPIV